MNSTCIPDVGYFDSPEFLSLVLHINTIISTLIHLFGFYCIMWKTPVVMKSAKLYLLSLHIWIVLFDYSFSILSIPFLLLPQFACDPLGILSWFDVPVLFQFTMMAFFIANMSASIVAIFESRFHVVCQFAWKQYWKRWRKGGIIFYHVVASCLSVLFGFLVPDQETAIRNVFAKLPCLPQYIYEANVFVLCEDCTNHLISFAAIGFSALFMGISFAFFLMRNAVVQLKSRTMSQKTFQLQKAFFIALGIQTLIPLCTLVIPDIYWFIAILVDYYNQAFTNFGLCLVSMHGLLSSMVMTFVHRPYRDTFLSFFKRGMIGRFGEHSFTRFLHYKRAVSVVAVIA